MGIRFQDFSIIIYVIEDGCRNRKDDPLLGKILSGQNVMYQVAV
jgi:hypothetical protein